MKKFITCDLDLRTSELDLYFPREQEQCLKNCTLPLNLLSDIWEEARFHPWRFQRQVSFYHSESESFGVSHGANAPFAVSFLQSAHSIVHCEVVGPPSVRTGGVTSWLIPDRFFFSQIWTPCLLTFHCGLSRATSVYSF